LTVFRAIGGIDAVRLADGAVLLKSDMVSCRLEGASAGIVADWLLPALAGWQSREALEALLADYPPEDVATVLAALVQAGLVRERDSAPEPGPPSAAVAALAALTVDEGEAAARLAALRVGLFGLDSLGLLVGQALSRAGVGNLLLADPARQEEAAGALRIESRTRLSTGPAALSREEVESLAAGLDLMIVTFDRGFLAARHWVNRAALATGTPALFADLSLVEALVGPTVLAGETPCYMCFRMRHLATADKFGDMFALEQHLDGRKDPAAARPLFPGLVESAAGLVVGEAMRLLAGQMPALAGQVVRFDAFVPALERHRLLRQPDCPHCRGIDAPVAPHG
jgi:bacteriocin biosynthesis cyclodehydratase domain-containing protein